MIRILHKTIIKHLETTNKKHSSGQTFDVHHSHGKAESKQHNNIYKGAYNSIYKVWHLSHISFVFSLEELDT